MFCCHIFYMVFSTITLFHFTGHFTTLLREATNAASIAYEGAAVDGMTPNQHGNAHDHGAADHQHGYFQQGEQKTYEQQYQ